MIPVLLLLAAAAAPVTIPDTPRGRQATAFLEAFNTGERAALEAFIEAHFDAEDLKRLAASPRAVRWAGLAAGIGPVEVRRYAESGEGASLIVAALRGGGLYELRVEMAPQPPFGILGADIDQVDASALADEGPAASDAALAEAIKKLLGQKAAKGEFSGTVLLAREGRPFCHEAVGLADREVGAPNRPDTKFNLGSINKIFTQVAIGQLLEAGKIRLDDTISKHLPDYPAEPGNRITIRQLVAMTSGLGDFFGERFEAMPKTRLRSLRDYLPLFVDQPLRFEPGKGREYSNAGYVVLGLIVEAASGQSYYDYVREKIFTPAGMADTDSFAIDAEVPNRATGYTREGQPDSPARSNRELLPARGSSAGGGYSTAPDLLRFAEALCADRLLSPAYTDWVFGRGEQDPIPDASLPRGRRRDLGTGWAGGTAGVNAVLDLELGRGYTIVVMANQDPPAAERLAEQIRRQLPAKR